MIEEKPEGGFLLGFGAGVFSLGLATYLAWKLHKTSYTRGWNGEELVSHNSLGIFGWTRSGVLVSISSFNKGKYDRDISINLSDLRSKFKTINVQTQYAIEKLQKIEYEMKEQPKIEISADETNFLKDLHKLA